MPNPKAAAREAAPAKFTAVSFSRLNDYRRCPRYAMYKHLRKISEGPESEALARGSAVHEAAQVFAQKSARTKCPPELATFEAEFRVLQKHRGSLVVEQQWALTRAWEPCDWFARDAWLRVIVDAGYRPQPGRMVVIDYKTGKIRDEHEEQVDLFCLVALCTHQDLQEAEAQLWYVDHGVQKPDETRIYTRKDIPALRRKWEGNFRAMLADGTFKEKPGRACTWCAYSRGKGGPCKY